MRVILIAHLLSTFSFVFCQDLQCRDDRNRTVDWYVLYKIPKLDSFFVPDVRKGRGYMYITSDSLADGWVLSSKTIFDVTNAVGNTLIPYYGNNQSEFWAMYNDQPPDKRSSSTGKGHAKGVIGGNKNGGFWLVHSVPHFPSPLPKFAYPSTGVKYGQSFLCISLSPSQLDTLGSTVLNYYSPHFYNSRITAEMSTVYPSMAKLVRDGPSSVDPPYDGKFNLTSSESLQFLVFAKSKKFSQDLYKWIADDLKVDLLCETWLNEEGALPSDCTSTYKVMNIRSISYSKINFNSSHDHSKWATSSDDKKPYVCVGGINRAKPQEQRGGGAVCLSNLELWKNYRALQKDVETCTKNQSQENINYLVETVL